MIEFLIVLGLVALGGAGGWYVGGQIVKDIESIWN